MKKSTRLYCGHLRPALPINDSLGTGIAIYSEPRGSEIEVCYTCSTVLERARMIRTGRATLYYSNGWVADWTGEMRFNAFSITRSEGRGFGRRYPIVTGRFYVDGVLWTFRQAGDNNTIARCRRSKDPR